jgi:NDP-sugar pyrophosphorylase family protein
MPHSTPIRPAFIMAQGLATRLSPATWFMTKALLKMVGTPMIRRITDLFGNHRFQDVGITTCIYADQIERWANTHNHLSHSPVRLQIYPNPFGINSNAALKKVNTSHGVLLAHKKKYGIASYLALTNLNATPFGELSRLLKVHNNDFEAVRKTDQEVFRQAVDAVAALRPVSSTKLPLFLVTGCDALTNADLTRLYEEAQSQIKRGKLACLDLQPFYDTKEVLEYGIVILNKEGVRFHEKPGLVSLEKDKHLAAFRSKDARGDSCFLVNPQLYVFDASVLAIVEAFATAGLSPDWGKHILPLLAYANLLGHRIMENEYWKDVGDYGTFIQAATRDILHGVGNFPIPYPQEPHRPLFAHKSAVIRGRVEHGLAIGQGSLISATALINTDRPERFDAYPGTVVEKKVIVNGRVTGSLLLDKVTVPEDTVVINSFIGADVHLPPGVRIEGRIVVLVPQIQGESGGQILLETPVPLTTDGKPANEIPRTPVRFLA